MNLRIIFKNQIIRLKDKLEEEKKNILPFVVSLTIATAFFLGIHFGGSYFVGAIWTFTGIIFTVLVLVIIVLAGFAVLKSLFLLAAELSLIIFLAQSFCSVPQRSEASDEALQSLLFVAILYILFVFVRSLWETLKEYYKKVENEKWSFEKIFTVSLFLIFTFWFLRAIYLVVSPIILGLCVYD